MNIRKRVLASVVAASVVVGGVTFMALSDAPSQPERVLVQSSSSTTEPTPTSPDVTAPESTPEQTTSNAVSPSENNQTETGTTSQTPATSQPPAPTPVKLVSVEDGSHLSDDGTRRIFDCYYHYSDGSTVAGIAGSSPVDSLGTVFFTCPSTPQQ